MPPRRIVVALLISIVLGACSSSEESPPPTTSASPQSAVIARNILQLASLQAPATARPAALLGVHVATYLAHGPGAIGAAMRAAHIQAAFQQALPTTNEAYLVLQQLGAALQIDVRGLLNRATSRRVTLDDYLRDLRLSVTGGKRQMQVLEVRKDALEAAQDEQGDRARTIERDLDRALRDKDYSTVARRQAELQPAESERRNTELQQEEVQSLLDIYADLLELAEERLDAIAENRDVLIAGHTVVEVPGIDDLGVLQRKRRRKLGL